MTISMIILSITGVFGGGEREVEAGRRFYKRRGDLDKMVRQVCRCTQKTCRKGC